MKTLRRLFLVAAMALASVPLFGQQIVNNITVQGWARASNGTAAAPRWSFTNEPDTGFFLSGANAIGVSTAGVERWIFNASGSFVPLIDNTYDIGNGTVNPRDVHVSRDLIFKTTGEGATFHGGGTLTGASGALTLAASGTNQNIALTPSGTGVFEVTQAGATTMRVRNSTAAITLESSATTSDAYTGTVTNHPFRVVTNNANRIYVTAGGNTLLGGLAVDGTGVLQLPTHTAAAGGIGLGPSWSVYTISASSLRAQTSDADIGVEFARGSSSNLVVSSYNRTGSSYGTLFFDSSSTQLRTNGGTTALTLDSSQNALFAGTINNATATSDASNFVGTARQFMFDSTASGMFGLVKGIASTQGVDLYTMKSRATDGTANTTINSGDTLFNLVIGGADGATFVQSAGIQAVSEGTIASTRVPSKLVFYTGTNAAPTVVTAALTLDSSQVATFGSAVFSGSDLRAAAASAVYWNGRSVLRSSADGLLTLLNNAENGFTRANLGGTSASEPAIARSTEYINIVDAAGGNTSGLMINSTAPVKSIRSAVAALNFGNILAAASADLTITVTDAAVGDSVTSGLPADPDASLAFDFFVSAANTVTVRAHNVGSIAVDQAEKTFRATTVGF